MKVILAVVGVFLVLAAVSVQASDRFVDECPDIASCAKVVGEMLGQKYIFDSDIKGGIQATANVEINRDNAELLFTGMLNSNGFTRVPAGQPNSFYIMRQRDARDGPIPMVTASLFAAPVLPNNWDLYTMSYKATSPDMVEYMARSVRSFMPANSRIVPEEVGGQVLVTDSAMNLKKVYDLIKNMDRKPTAEFKRKWQAEAAQRKAEMLRQKQEEPPVKPNPAPKKSGANKPR